MSTRMTPGGGSTGTTGADDDFRQLLKQPFKPSRFKDPPRKGGSLPYRVGPAPFHYKPSYETPPHNKPWKYALPKPGTYKRRRPGTPWRPGWLKYGPKVMKFNPFTMLPFSPTNPETWATVMPPPSIQGPSGYEFPTMGTPDFHWGPYSCGITPRIAVRWDNGWLSPESSFSCVAGQVFNQDLSPDEYGADFTFVVNGAHGMPSLTMGRRNNSMLAPRMTLIEHWGWIGPKPDDPAAPANYRPPHTVPTPGLRPPPPIPMPKPDPRADGHPKPSPKPTPPGGGSGPPYRPDPKKPEQLPRRGERKKPQVPKDPFGNWYGLLTELQDHLDCLEKAYYGKRAGYAPLHKRIIRVMNDFYKKPPTVKQLELMVACMMINGASDRAIAQFGKLAKEITKSPYWQRPLGPGAGGWQGRMHQDFGPITYEGS